MQPGIPWHPIVAHYERCLERHGIEPRGVDWPNGRDLEVRFATALDLLAAVPPGRRPVLLDVGCGPGLLLDYLAAARRLEDVEYRGIDLSERMIEAARSRWPDHAFATRDIVAEPLAAQSVDVVLMNGVLTERLELEHSVMVGLAQSIIGAAFRAARIGIAFNIMSRHVDWERPDLFHWSFDEVAFFLQTAVSRHYAFRADYGLYEFTTLVWREPRRPAPLVPERWWQR